jgi:hypothetical protein
LSKLRRTTDVATNTLNFCTSIVSAHRVGAFGGKATLWDFMKDATTNLNRNRQGKRFSANTRAFAQTLKIYRGMRTCDMFSLNFTGPTFSSVKRDNKKGVQFIPCEHKEVFQSVANIYR